VNAQLESARETETPPGHEGRVRAFGEAMTAADAENADSSDAPDSDVDDADGADE
jgi:hypothetical protein